MRKQKCNTSPRYGQFSVFAHAGVRTRRLPLAAAPNQPVARTLNAYAAPCCREPAGSTRYSVCTPAQRCRVSAGRAGLEPPTHALYSHPVLRRVLAVTVAATLSFASPPHRPSTPRLPRRRELTTGDPAHACILSTRILGRRTAPFSPSLFLTASRMVLPRDPSTIDAQRSHMSGNQSSALRTR